jgi:hypothetical protein
MDLYDNGVKFYQDDLDCSPCWKDASATSARLIARMS